MLLRTLIERWRKRQILRYAHASEVRDCIRRVDELERAWVEQTEKVQHYFRKAAARERRRAERAMAEYEQVATEPATSDPILPTDGDRKALLRAKFAQRRNQGVNRVSEHQVGEGPIPG